MKAIKILLAVVASLAALAIIAALLLVAFFEPNDYKGYVTSWVEERTGRPFAIEGDLELAFFPWLAVETEGVTLGNPRGFDDAEAFASVERIAAGVKLLPLLEQRFEIGKVRAEGLRLNLVRGADGRGNWQDFSGETANTAAADGSERGGNVLDNLDVESVEIRKGEVYWHAGADGLRYVASGIRLETGSIRAGAPVNVSMAVRIQDMDSQRRFDVETQSRVGLEALRAASDGAMVELDGFDLALRMYDPAMRELAFGTLAAERLIAARDGRVDAGASRLDARVAGAAAVPEGLELGADWSSASFDPGAGTFAVNGLTTRVAGIVGEWQLAGRNMIDAPELEGMLEVAQAPIGTALQTFGVALPAGIEPGTLGPLDASAQFRIAMSLAGAGEPADAPAGVPTIGPYRLDALDLDGMSIALLGAALHGDAALDGEGVIRADLAVPELAPSDALRALAAANAPDALDLTAIDRVSLSSRIALHPPDGRLVLEDVRAALLGAELTGALEVLPAAPGGSRVLRGTLHTTPIAAERLAALVGELLPAAISPQELGTVSLNARFEHDGAARKLELAEVSLDAFGLSAAGQAAVTHLGEQPVISGQARVAAFSPRDLMRRFGQPVPETSDSAALQRAAATARFEIDAESGRFRDIDLLLDDTRITGEFAVDGFSNPAHRFTLAIDRVNVDRYLPPRTSDLPEDADDDARTAGDIELPAEALRNLRIAGRVSVGDLRLAGLEFRSVATSITVGDGRGSLDSARADLYGGEFSGSFSVDTTGEAPGLRLAGRATSLALDPLITALTGDANLSGTGDFDLDLTGRGVTVIENVESASGNVAFSMRDGAIEGFNLGRALCVVYNTTQRLPAPAEQPARTQYLQIGGTASVENGVATSPDLLARAPFMDLTGAGRLTLAEQRLDYSLEAKLTGSPGIRGCEAMDQLVGESLPLTLRGTVTDPEIRPDFSEIIQRRLRDAVRDRVGDRLRDLLR